MCVIFTVTHCPQVPNQKVIDNLDSIIEIVFGYINDTGVLMWKASMLLEIFSLKDGSKFGYFFWLKTDHGQVNYEIFHTLYNLAMIFYI